MKTKTALSRITALLLCLALLVGMTPLTALGAEPAPKASESLGTSTPPMSSGITPFALADYHTGDVAVINTMISSNGLAATPNDPDSWGFASWDGSTPKRIGMLDISNKNLVGTLDVSGLTSLSYLNCSDNQLTTLDISGLTTLEEMYCYNNQLTVLDVSGLTSLTNLNCDNNQLTTLDISALNSLIMLSCSNNQLTTLDISGLTTLEEMYCYNNQLTVLDVSGLTSLTNLNCDNNQLTTLDISALNSLIMLSCSNNQLTALDVSGLSSLRYLGCESNHLTTLDVSGLSSLRNLICESNRLTTLDISGLTSLTMLECYNNQLTTITLIGANALEIINCANNRLTHLDIPAPISLTSLYCSRNYMPNLAAITGTAGTIEFEPQLEPPVAPEPPVNPPTTSGGGSSSGSGGGGSSKPDSRPIVGGTTTGTTRPLTKAEATKLFDTALAAKPTGATTLSIKVRNATSVSKEVLAELAALAKKNGVTLTVHFDTVVGGKVVGRISVNPALVTNNLDLTIKENKALAARFAKFYSNPLAVFTVKTGGSVAIPMPANLKAEGLVLCSYDAATNTYLAIPNAKPWVDKNGYLHFELPAGTEVVISQGKLVKK